MKLDELKPDDVKSEKSKPDEPRSGRLVILGAKINELFWDRLPRDGWFASFVIFALAALSGVLLATIHAPFDWPLIGIWGMAAAAWIVAKTDRPKLVGFGLGFGYFFVMMQWITSPFAVEAELYGWMAPFVWVMMAAGLALFWLPVFAFFKRGWWQVSVTFAAMEYLRGTILTGLPWGMVAYGFADFSIAQIASVLGSYALSGLIVLVIIWLGGPVRIGLRGAGMFLMAALLSLGVNHGLAEFDEDANFRVNLVQANFTQREAFDQGLAPQHIDTQIELSDSSADLVIWPEGSTIYSPGYEPEWAATLTERIGKPLLMGAPHYEDDRFYNSAYLIGKDGAIAYRYDKQHLVPFGEYIPLGSWLQAVGIDNYTISRFSMSKGVWKPWPETTGLPAANVLICYEGLFPQYSQREGAYIALITNDAWFGNLGGPAQHLVAARFRAIEAGKPLARTARTGITAMISANGAVVQSIPLNTQGSITSEIGPRYHWTFYHYLREWPLLLAVILMLWPMGREVVARRKERVDS